ncbi:MAG: hypothetical protein WA020_02985 [Candidatus Acidiferrales bacterium]
MADCFPKMFVHAGRISRILLALCLVPASAFATTIIAVRTAEFVIIATDSKATYLGQAGPPTVCKIYNNRQFYFAAAGLDHDARRNFYVKNIVAQSLLPSANFDDQVARVENAVSQSLMTELNRLQREDPGTYAFTMHSSREVVSLVLAQYQDGVPHLAARGFGWIANPAPAIKIDRVTCPGDCSDGRELVSLGEKAAAEKFMRENTGEDFDLPALATKLVQLEIENSPGDVGPPINEVRLNKDGVTWISNGAGCPVLAQ